jgi:co-chaperonin GroES (HSP10)
MPALKALPGRVILRFPQPVAKVGSIIVPETSQLRPEFGEIADVGAATSLEEEKTRRDLLELQKSGKRIAVSFASGISFWRDYDVNALGGGDWSWLKSAKAYRMSELAAYVVEE